MMKCTQDISQVQKLDLKQVIESNRVQEKFKAKWTQSNRKHKIFVSRFEPLL